MVKGISFQLFIFILIYINSRTHRIFITFLNILLGKNEILLLNISIGISIVLKSNNF